MIQNYTKYIIKYEYCIHPYIHTHMIKITTLSFIGSKMWNYCACIGYCTTNMYRLYKILNKNQKKKKCA